MASFSCRQRFLVLALNDLVSHTHIHSGMKLTTQFCEGKKKKSFKKGSFNVFSLISCTYLEGMGPVAAGAGADAKGDHGVADIRAWGGGEQGGSLL